MQNSLHDIFLCYAKVILALIFLSSYHLFFLPMCTMHIALHVHSSLFWRVATAVQHLLFSFDSCKLKENRLKMKRRHSPKILEKVVSSLSWSKIWYYIFSLLAGFNSKWNVKRYFVLYYPFWLDKRGNKIRNV